MKRPIALTLAVLAVGAALSAAYWAGSRHSAVATDSRPPVHAAETAGDTGKPARKILYYRNPMGLPDTSPEPKKDSMGMDYIPVYDGDEPDGEGAVKVSPARLQTLGVKTAMAKLRALDAEVRAVGRVEINERAIHDVAPRFEGWIERLHVNASGDPVKRGQPLFSVYSPELVSAQKELAIARELKLDAPDADPAARAAAARLAEAARERLANWQVAAPDGKVASRLTFRSPATGFVLEKKAVEGMRFMAGTAIYRIADLSTVWVIADVYEKDLARVKVGDVAKVTLDAFPDQKFEARLTYLYPTLNAATRTTPVRLELANRDGLLRPGMFAHVDIASAGSALRLTVPKSALIDTGERQVVLRVEGEGRFKPQPVKIGLRGRDHVEILEGLEDGAEVVVAANFLIDAESNLKAALSTFSAPEAKTAKSYQAVGSVDSVDVSSDTVSMNHEPIPALQWPAMTMDFGLASKDVIEGVLPGQPVRFTFEDRGDGEFVIIKIEQAGATAHTEH
ncbi:MAG: efflux RND transporter periplasmic adaptor subunit [Rhodocyclaceae bacterium]|nr:efflux RND transporter periplasmic adaptor subunit [Rhodocyclaceae bacterium]